jgi:hypothetical protein
MPRNEQTPNNTVITDCSSGFMSATIKGMQQAKATPPSANKVL